VFLPRISHILDQMYRGGYSAVVDASKYFYQFPTHPDDRPFLGLRHPRSAIFMEYAGLPMGGANSPAIACRYGLNDSRRSKELLRLIDGGLGLQRKTMIRSWVTGST
jgi:hypothetical protein